MKSFLIFLIAVLLNPLSSFSQLNGTYTIGGSNPDYLTITDAANALITSSASGPVTFNIRPGIYNEKVNLYAYVPPFLQLIPITFQSEALDSTSVIINNPTTTGNTFTLGSGYFVFRWLTINDSVLSTINSDRYLEIYNCRITGYNNAIYCGNLILRNSFVQGRILGHIKGEFTNNEITGDIQQSLVNVFSANKITGDVDAGGTNVLFNDNTVLGNVNLSSDTINALSNYVIGGLYINYIENGQVAYNQVSGQLRFSHPKFSSCHNNLANNGISISYADSFKVFNNKVSGILRCDFSRYVDLYNNFIFGDVDFGHSTLCTFKLNNFSEDLQNRINIVYSDSNTICNNILPPIYYETNRFGINFISANNYPFGGGVFDSAPVFIDPKYRSTTDLHATNAQLIGKANYDSTITFDIDNKTRSFQTTLSANEICFSGDTMNVYCGDSIILSVCDSSHYSLPVWSPSTGLDIANTIRPKLYATTSGWYFVSDSGFSFSDSIYVNVLPFNVSAFRSNAIGYCGQPLYLHGTYHSNAIYQWTPTDSLSNPFGYMTKANPSHSISYVVTANVIGCSISSDTIDITFSPLPTSFFYLDSVYHNYFEFLNASLCWDSCLWDFGDSTQSILTNPNHTYADTGTFLITLITCNNFGCDTIQAYISVDSINLVSIVHERAESFVKIIPNPANENITIRFNKKIKNGSIQIFNSTGQLIINSSLDGEESKTFYIGSLPGGVYFIKLLEGRMQFTKKLIVVN